MCRWESGYYQEEGRGMLLHSGPIPLAQVEAGLTGGGTRKTFKSNKDQRQAALR